MTQFRQVSRGSAGGLAAIARTPQPATTCAAIQSPAARKAFQNTPGTPAEGAEIAEAEWRPRVQRRARMEARLASAPCGCRSTLPVQPQSLSFAFGTMKTAAVICILVVFGLIGWFFANRRNRRVVRSDVRKHFSMRGKVTIVSGLLAVVAIVLLFIYSEPTPASVSISFKGYADRSYRYTNLVCGVFVISNTGPRSVLFKGVGASSEQQLTQVLSERGWVDTNPWLSPLASSFWLSRGQSREVPILAEKDVSWRIRFRFRERGFADLCPEIVWQWLPDSLRKTPKQTEITTETVPALSRLR